MTYLFEVYYAESNWLQKISIMDMYHLVKKQKNSNWTLQDTANYFRVSRALVSENLLIADNIDLIEHCDSRDKALIFLRSMKQYERHDKNG